MSFYTALTGLNAATAQLGVTSNNIANVGTSGFKRSRADFGDIFATSPLQKASSVVGQGVSLKQVSQEFSQGNIQVSANSLDLAITGDGFFMMKSSDGLQDIYTRNGAFTMNDQFNVVNSAGQALMAATVDSSGKADTNNLVRLTIPKQTAGEAKQTSLIELGINFPADAEVITDDFNRTNPATYNKTTALTVYDQGGNGYLATVYYVKTQNASQLSPFNKWQTYVFIGDTQVNAALLQATDANGERLYVNKYGQQKPEGEVADLLVNRKTQMFALDDLTDTRTSSPATVTGAKADAYDLTAEGGINFSTLSARDKEALKSLFTIDIDGSEQPVTLDLSMLAGRNEKLNGVAIAKEMTNALNRTFGDERYFDFTGNAGFRMTVDGTALDITLTTQPEKQKVAFSAATDAGTITVGGVSVAVTAGQTAADVAAAARTALLADADFAGRTIANNGDGSLTITYTAADKDILALDVDGAETGVEGEVTSLQPYVGSLAEMTTETAVDAMQRKIDDAVATAGLDAEVTVSYDRATKGFRFVEAEGLDITLRGPNAVVNGSTVPVANEVLGLGTTAVTAAEDGAYSTNGNWIFPNGEYIREESAQRHGLKVTFDSVSEKFLISSGTTGDDSSIVLADVNDFAASVFGLAEDEVKVSSTAVRGIVSQPAVTRGTQIALNVNNNFAVDETNNRFIVTVDDVKGEVVLPTNANYTLDGFIAELEKRINLLANDSGSTVSGVKVEYERQTNSLKFTTGTTGSDSFIKVSGSSTWGLANIDAGRGQTSSWVKPTQFTEFIDGVPVRKYINERGEETSSADGFTTLPEWSPLFLDKGELTFDTGGRLISPRTGAQLDTVFLEDGKGALRINIDYSQSTQFSSPFSVNSQSQDGAPEGDLVGVNIGDDGLVQASYSNGSQLSLAKIVLVNFSNPTGLRQIGDSNFYATSSSGTPKLGEAGAAGFGVVRAGARERANVDLTQELVDLITAQRNFQANAKAIETSTSLTQAIINIRA